MPAADNFSTSIKGTGFVNFLVDKMLAEAFTESDGVVKRNCFTGKKNSVSFYKNKGGIISFQSFTDELIKFGKIPINKGGRKELGSGVRVRFEWKTKHQPDVNSMEGSFYIDISSLFKLIYKPCGVSGVDHFVMELIEGTKPQIFKLKEIKKCENCAHTLTVVVEFDKEVCLHSSQEIVKGRRFTRDEREIIAQKGGGKCPSAVRVEMISNITEKTTTNWANLTPHGLSNILSNVPSLSVIKNSFAFANRVCLH